MTGKVDLQLVRLLYLLQDVSRLPPLSDWMSPSSELNFEPNLIRLRFLIPIWFSNAKQHDVIGISSENNYILI